MLTSADGTEVAEAAKGLVVLLDSTPDEHLHGATAVSDEVVGHAWRHDLRVSASKVGEVCFAMGDLVETAVSVLGVSARVGYGA